MGNAVALATPVPRAAQQAWSAHPGTRITLSVFLVGASPTLHGAGVK